MATAQENLARLQEIHRRGLAEKLPPDIRSRYDEALRRGLIGDQNVSGNNVNTSSSVPSLSDQQTESVTQEPTIGEKAIGLGETALTAITGAVAEPLAGLYGISEAFNPFQKEGAGARGVESVRESLTYQPRTEQGQKTLKGFGEMLKPVGEGLSALETDLGTTVYDVTGSRELATIAHTIPAAMLEAVGVAGAKGAVKGAKTTVKRAKSAAERQGLVREIADAAPTSKQLKDTARVIFNEIDETGTTINPNSINGLVNKLSKEAFDKGLDVDVTPKSAKALERFRSLTEADNVSLRDLERARAVAQNAAASLDAPEKALGARMIETVDDFLEKATSNTFVTGNDAAEIGKKYKTARKLWGQARRSELLQDAVTKAKDQASGFENGLRVQFRSILNNKKQRKFFNSSELDAMKKVVQGTKGANLAKLFGRLGFSEQQAMNIVGAGIGATAGATMFGAPGAVAVPLLGNVSRKLAQRLTAKNAAFADTVIRAGKDAEKIAKAYMKNTPKQLRSADELAQLLMRPDVAIDSLKVTDDFVVSAVNKAAENRAMLAGALASSGQETQEDNKQ